MSRQIAFVVVGILVVSLFGGCGMRTIPATDTNTRQTDNNDSPQITDTSINTDIFRPASPTAGAGGFDLPPIQPDHSSLMPPNTLQELGNTSTNLIGNTGSLPVTDINPNINDPTLSTFPLTPTTPIPTPLPTIPTPIPSTETPPTLTPAPPTPAPTTPDQPAPVPLTQDSATPSDLANDLTDHNSTEQEVKELVEVESIPFVQNDVDNLRNDNLPKENLSAVNELDGVGFGSSDGVFGSDVTLKKKS